MTSSSPSLSASSFTALLGLASEFAAIDDPAAWLDLSGGLTSTHSSSESAESNSTSFALRLPGLLSNVERRTVGRSESRLSNVVSSSSSSELMILISMRLAMYAVTVVAGEARETWLFVFTNSRCEQTHLRPPVSHGAQDDPLRPAAPRPPVCVGRLPARPRDISLASLRARSASSSTASS